MINKRMLDVHFAHNRGRLLLLTARFTVFAALSARLS